MFSTQPSDPTPSPATTGGQTDPWASWLRLAGTLALIGACTFLLARVAAFDWVVALVSRYLSPDGALSPIGRARLAGALLGVALLAATIGVLLWALSRRPWRMALDAAIRWDALRSRGLATPNPYSVIAGSTGVALLVIALWTLRARLGEPALVLFTKEGPLEQATFVLELVASGLCAGAAMHWRPRGDRSPLLVRTLYALCAFVLFVVAMEEINWGQTLFGFETPAPWAAINYQQETSLHNLLDRDALTATWRLVAPAFGVGVLVMVVWSARAPRSVIGAIAPHAGLIPLAVAIVYGGARLHPEVIELLLALFFAFYSWRIYAAARSSAGSQALGKTHPWTVIRAIVAVGFIVVLLSRADWSQAAQKLSYVSTWAVVGVLTLMVLGLVVSTWKWSLALRMHDLSYPFPYLWRALTAGFFFNNFLPTAIGGDAYRVYRTLPSTRYRSRALSAVAVERAMGFLVLLALGALGALALTDQFDAARVYCWILLAATLLGTMAFLALEHGWLRAIVERGRMARLMDAIGHNLSLLHRRRDEWLTLASASMAFQVISIGVVFILFDLVGTRVTLAQCALIAAVVGASATIPISINGLGVMEGTLVGMSALVGIDYNQALIVAVARRSISLLLGALCGLLYLTETRTASGIGRLTPKALLQALREGAAMLLRARAPANKHTIVEPDVPLARAGRGDASMGRWSTELLEYTHDAIIIWEMDGDGIVYWNRAAEQLYGYCRRDALGRVTHEMLKTKIAGGVNHLERALARFGVWVGELRHTARDGREIVVDARLALLAQHNDRWLVLEVNRDVTDTKNAAAERAAAERQLAELRRLHVAEGTSARG